MSGTGIELITSARAKHAAPERVLAEDRLVEDVMDLVLGLVLVHGDLLQHDLALGVHLGIGRPKQHLREQVEGALGMGVEQSRVQMRGLLAGRGVDRGPKPVEDLRDLDRRVALCALEQQVLEKVGDPGLRRGLVTRASPHPEPEGDRAHRGNGLGDDPDAGVELGYLGSGAVALTGALGARRARRRGRRLAAASPPRPPPSRRRGGGPGSPVPTEASSSGLLPSTSGSSVRRRPMRPRSLSTSTTVTSISSPELSTSSTVPTRSPGFTLEMCKQAVGALRQLDEGAEVGRLHDLAGRVAVPDLGLFGDRGDAIDSRLDQLAGGRIDAHRAIVVDVDLGLELLRDRADRLATLADQRTDLLGVDLDGGDPRRVLGELLARLGDRLAPSSRG